LAHPFNIRFSSPIISSAFRPLETLSVIEFSTLAVFYRKNALAYAFVQPCGERGRVKSSSRPFHSISRKNGRCLTKYESCE
jgi:hypothetical protein